MDGYLKHDRLKLSYVDRLFSLQKIAHIEPLLADLGRGEYPPSLAH